jgi:hypothetical protein
MGKGTEKPTKATPMARILTSFAIDFFIIVSFREIEFGRQITRSKTALSR